MILYPTEVFKDKKRCSCESKYGTYYVCRVLYLSGTKYQSPNLFIIEYAIEKFLNGRWGLL